jgi:hypothetical protein
VKKLFCLLFVILVMLPVTMWLFGRTNGNRDNTVGHGFPLPAADLWMEKQYYRAVEGWFQEAMPVAGPLKFFNNWLDYHLFSTTTASDVHIGTHGWLFAGKGANESVESANLQAAGKHLFLNIQATEKIITASGRKFVFTVVPAKAAIYPEYFGGGNRDFLSPIYAVMRKAHQRHPLSGFVPLEAVLKKAKLSGSDVYGRRSRLWTCDGAFAAANQILDARNLPHKDAADTTACPPPDMDLYRQLLGQTPRLPPPISRHNSGPHAVEGPSAIVYGDEYLIRLLPFITHAFKGLEVVDTTTQPTFDGSAISGESEWILLASGADNLQRLYLDLESLYSAAPDRLQGLVKREIDLAEAEAVTGCSVNVTSDGLQIRSSGSEAFFSLPPTSGSTNSVFRAIKLAFSSEHQGRVTIRMSPEIGPLRKTPSRERRDLIIPLPFAESVRVQINPGDHPGVFTLQRAELLNFYGDNPPPVPIVSDAPETIGDIYSGMEIEPEPLPENESVVEPPDQTAAHPIDEIPELFLLDIGEGRIFQRKGKDADIVVTGTYTGVSGPVEARVVSADSDEVLVPWTVVDGAPENGLFTGILGHVPQGGWYRLEVRSGLAPWVVEKGTNRWGVGMLVACIGQSNMREWFYTGTAHHPAAAVRVHREGVWISPDRTGNGALALGNRLSAALKIPVGLLDDSVNGTGLTAKAEWGKGFWRDTGPDSIYRRFVDGVNGVGGSVEYVLWMQGEADAARGTVTREEYRQALERFITDQIRVDIRNGSTRPQLPFLMIPLVKRPTGRDKTCQWIRSAQMDVLETVEECHLAAVSMDLENRGRQHLAPASYTTLGVRTAQTILYLLGKTPYHRGPAVKEITRPSSRIIHVVMEHRGGNDFSPWTDITGFEVLSDGQPQAIAAVSRQSGHTIRIEMEDNAPGTVRVRYLYGAHPNTSNPVRDNTDLRLPLEPFAQ